jgi:hypothetical protein
LILSNVFDSGKFSSEHFKIPLGTGESADIKAFDDYLFEHRSKDSTYGAALFENILKNSTSNLYHLITAVDISS